MSIAHKRPARVATLAAILLVTALGVQVQAAGVFVPPPQRGSDVVVHDRGGCLAANQAQALVKSSIRDLGYQKTFRVETIENERVRGFGVKDGNQWFKFVMELCHGSLVQETKLKGKPNL